MKDIIEGFKKSFVVLGKDKLILFFALFPIVIGIIFYSLLWSWLFNDVLEQGKSWIEQQVSLGSWSGIIYYVFMGVLGIGFWLLLSWTFVLIVSFIASPFNDIISNRVERAVGGQCPIKIGDSFSRMLNRLGKTIVNEVKKVFFILFLSLVAFLISWVPLLLPLSIALSTILMAISFLDYNWCRHNMELKDCIKDLKSSFITYGLSGGLFLTLISIPIVNLLILSYGTIYYTVLFSQKRVREL